MIDLGQFAFTIAGIVVGFAVGVTGVGGGSLMTPILILFFGFSPAHAVGTDLLYAAGTKSFGAWLHGRQGTVAWRLVGLLILGSIPGSILTVTVLHEIGISETVQQVMTFTLGAAVAVTAVLTLARHRLVRLIRRERPHANLQPNNRLRAVITVAGAFLLGVLVTLSSVGAGVLGTMMLFWLYPRLPAVKIVGSDIAYAVPLTLVAGLGHMTLGTTDFAVLGYLLLGSLPGIWLGTRVGYRVPDGVLRPVVASLLLVIGAGMLIETFVAAL